MTLGKGFYNVPLTNRRGNLKNLANVKDPKEVVRNRKIILKNAFGLGSMKAGVVLGDKRLHRDNVRENEENVEGSQRYLLEALDAGQES